MAKKSLAKKVIPGIEMEKLAKEAAGLSITVPGVQPKLSLDWIKTELEKEHQGRST